MRRCILFLLVCIACGPVVSVAAQSSVLTLERYEALLREARAAAAAAIGSISGLPPSR
ncbi:MAG: hypothetical protein HC822_25560 [Oscillochloris sp.]|nr:hypothetical protein [Oscillochloris sp.]